MICVDAWKLAPCSEPSAHGCCQAARKDEAKRQTKEKAAAAEKLKAAEAAAARARDALAAAQAGAKDRDAALKAAQDALAAQEAASAAKDVEVGAALRPQRAASCEVFAALLTHRHRDYITTFLLRATPPRTDDRVAKC